MKLITLAMAATAMAGGAYAQGTNQQPTVPATDVAKPAASAAQTDRTGFYIGGGPVVVVFDEEDAAGDPVAVGAIQGRLGYSFNRFFAIEGEVSVGVVPYEYDYGFGIADLDLKSEYGAFAVFSAPLGNVVDLYARVGYANAELELDDGFGTITDEDSGAAYGVGIDWNIHKVILRLDYTRYDLETKGDAIGFNVLAKF